jgi:ribosomal protein S27AE
MKTNTKCPMCGGDAKILLEEHKYWLRCFNCEYRDILKQAGRIYRNKIAVKQKLKEKEEINKQLT